MQFATIMLHVMAYDKPQQVLAFKLYTKVPSQYFIIAAAIWTLGFKTTSKQRHLKYPKWTINQYAVGL